MAGEFVELECTGATPKLVVRTADGKVALLMDQPDKVVITGIQTETIQMNCGPQKAARVSVQYQPAEATQADVKGSVRAIQFE